MNLVQRVKYLNWSVVLYIFSVLILISAFVYYSLNFSVNTDVFFALIGCSISLLLAGIAVKQNNIQRNNLKLQFFEKRYQIYKIVSDTYSYLLAKDTKNEVYLGYTDELRISHAFFDMKNELIKQVNLSQCLFPDYFFKKLCQISSEYKKIVDAYVDMIKKQSELSIENPNMAEEFREVYISYLKVANEKQKEIEQQLSQKYSQIFKNIISFNEKSDAYIKYIEDSKIMSEFDQYLKISKLDR